MTRAAIALALVVGGCEPRATAPTPSTADASPASTTAPSAPSDTSASASSSAPSATAIRYLALGDSFTIGTGSSPEQAFPARLAGRLRAAGSEIALENLGVNGYTTDDLLRDELPVVSRFRPTIVTLAIGANDLVHGSSVERYRTQLGRIFAALTASGVEARRVLCLPQPDWALSPVARDFGAPEKIERDIDAFNAVLAEEAKRVGAVYLDLSPLLREEARAKMIAGDGLHPSALAHEAWAKAIDERAHAMLVAR